MVARTDRMTYITYIEVRSHVPDTDNPTYIESDWAAYASSRNRPLHFDQT
jgi:hypothetical protein